MAWIFPLLLLIIFEGIADILSKEWAVKGQPTRWILAISAYAIANIFWLYALKNGSGLTRGGIIFSVGSALLATIIGLVLYKESLSKTETSGVILGVLALFLIFWQDK